MSTRFTSADRNQPLLVPPDLRQQVPDDDLVHFVIGAVDTLDTGVFKVNLRGSGSAQYPPHMMLSLLIYCYANGVFPSRRIERATHRDIAVRCLTAATHPDLDTIAAFRVENFEAVRHNKKSAYEQAFNAQATVDADGSQPVLSGHLSQCGSDRNELVGGSPGHSPDA